MAKGLLRANGKLDVAQFWPGGGSDADTVMVQVNQSSFEFSSDPASRPFKVTRTFEGAKVRGSHVTDAIHGGKITVRLQGVDATELHFAALLTHAKTKAKKTLKNNGTRYRQFLGETATTKLHDFLNSGKGPTFDCQVVAPVDHPNDVFDTYGRFVGMLFVKKATKWVNVNEWLVSSGWAFPSFYTTMAVADIRSLGRLANGAKKKGKGVWHELMSHIGQLNVALVYRPKGRADPKQDLGRVLIPKLFRREVKLYVLQLNQLFTKDFRAYLAAQDDPWVTLAAFLKNPLIKRPAKTSKNGNLSSLVDAREDFNTGPGDIVFFDKPSTLVAANGKKVTSW